MFKKSKSRLLADFIESVIKTKVSTLDSAFGIPKSVIFNHDKTNAPYILLKHRNGSEVMISLRGANITSWKTSDGKERIWSKPNDDSCFDFGIVPSFPQYGRAFQHGFKFVPRDGFLRSMIWEVAETLTADNITDYRPTVVLRTSESSKSYLQWPYEFKFEYKISIGIQNNKRHLKKSNIYHKTNNSRNSYLFPDIKRAIRFLEEGVVENEMTEISSSTDVYPINYRTLMCFRERYLRNASKLNKEDYPETNVIPPWVNGSPIVEGIIAKRRRLEKERGQPTYFKYKITRNKQISPAETFAKLGYPEDLSLSIKIFNTSFFPFQYTIGLKSHFAIQNFTRRFVEISGLGLLPYIDVSNPSIPDLVSDTNDSVSGNVKALDRWYQDTSVPNEIFYSPGDRSNIKILESEGFDNIHVWFPRGLANRSDWRQFFGCSPCRAIVPIKLKPGEKWRAKATFRWFPVISTTHSNFVRQKKKYHQLSKGYTFTS
jgi:D-hexose-6-phosphate mutarotase